jgi:hypothetical protein
MVNVYGDELLGSPQFGVRWARHWMDLVRYSESAGHEYDYEFEGAWRYRDYLVRAFNDDLPYDQLVREHIVGDLLPARVVQGRNESLLATGWWQLQEQPTSPVDLLKDEAERLDNQIDVLGKTFQGLTIGCARCHDHKFDPIPTTEYYGLFGIMAASPGMRCWANEPELDAIATLLQQHRQDWEERHRELLSETNTAISSQPAPWSIQLGSSESIVGDFAKGLPDNWICRGETQWVTQADEARWNRPPGVWSGLLSKKLPAMIRSPQFTIEHEYLDVLVAGQDSTVQVIIANFQMIRDPIYNGLRQQITETKPQWIRIPVGRWRGMRAQVEVFTGIVDGSHRILHTQMTDQSHFGVMRVLQTDVPEPPLPPECDLPKDSELEQSWAENVVNVGIKFPAPERFLGMCDTHGRDLPFYRRGEPSLASDASVPRSYLIATGHGDLRIEEGSGRRELAEAIANEFNPLTARVIVNRLWQHLYGRGLVATVDNFGTMGERPSHPELLDYLANRLVQEHGWRLKPLIKEMVSSHAFWIESGNAPASDATNMWLSKFRMQRLTAEAIRDSLLVVAGNLDESLEGEPIPVPHRLTGTGSDSGNNDAPNGPMDGNRRRSLYLSSRRNYPSLFLEVFDKPSSLSTFGKRDQTSASTQALTLLNDPFVQMQAAAWANNCIQASARDHSDEVNGRVVRMFRQAFAREPTEEELRDCAAWFADSSPHAAEIELWCDLALGLINSKEFIYVP